MLNSNPARRADQLRRATPTQRTPGTALSLPMRSASSREILRPSGIAGNAAAGCLFYREAWTIESKSDFRSPDISAGKLASLNRRP